MHSWAQLVPFIVAVSGVAHAHSSSGVPLRKSLSFGPQLEHARFTTDPSPVAPSLKSWSNDKLSAVELAQNFVVHTLGHAEQSFKIRDDSYFDANTGVWHMYVRQTVFDTVEVADGDINLNIHNGQVISYGDSFYRGPQPDLMDVRYDAQTGEHDQAHYCSLLRSSLSSQLASDAQLPPSPSTAPHAERLTKLYEHNCLSLHALEPEHYAKFTQEKGVIADAKDAALYFIIAAHPSPKRAQAILENFGSHRDDISSTVLNHFRGSLMFVEVLRGVTGTEGDVKATFAYVQSPCTEDSECVEGQTSKLNLVWKLEVEMHDNWYEAYVDAHLPTRIVSVVDWVSDYPGEEAPTNKCWPAPEDKTDLLPVGKKPKTDKNGVIESLYRVWPWGVNDPSIGKRDIEKNPYDKTASPIGWHAIPSKNNPKDDNGYFQYKSDAKDGTVCKFETTWGNNVQAQENWEGRNSWFRNFRPNGNDNLTFVYPYGAGLQHDGETVEPNSYIDLVVTQLFYTVNKVHDLYYRYGFDEVSGNFQNHNFGKGGREDDAVIANAQDGSGYNNANFATPPDGTRGRMRMYVWDTATPFRDGDLEAGIVIHEYSHGLSTRLTGGPANSGCLGWGESGGMGEGWGDFLATVIRANSTYSDYPMGAWADNRAKGIRNYIYSLNLTVNPSVYKTLDGPGYWGVHAIGEVWAEILWIVLYRLVEKHGWNEELFPPQPDKDGNFQYPNDFYRPPFSATAGANKDVGVGAPIPKHGNTLMVQLVLNGMKLQPCRPSFFAARDAILQADQILTGGENLCELWQGFSTRGLGPNAMLKGGTPWGGGIRTNDFELPLKCGGGTKKPGDDDDE